MSRRALAALRQTRWRMSTATGSSPRGSSRASGSTLASSTRLGRPSRQLGCTPASTGLSRPMRM
eukprot:8020936-Lingulodinium_polyedra.AAC.1